jgi:hypothetical protein
MHYVKIYNINTDSMAIILNFKNALKLFWFFSKSQLSTVLSREFLIDFWSFKLLWNDIVIKQKNKEENFRASISGTWLYILRKTAKYTFRRSGFGVRYETEISLIRTNNTNHKIAESDVRSWSHNVFPNTCRQFVLLHNVTWSDCGPLVKCSTVGYTCIWGEWHFSYINRLWDCTSNRSSHFEMRLQIFFLAFLLAC